MHENSDVFLAESDLALDKEADLNGGEAVTNPFVSPATISQAKLALANLRSILNLK
jgi:hypothetical protein